MYKKKSWTKKLNVDRLICEKSEMRITNAVSDSEVVPEPAAMEAQRSPLEEVVPSAERSREVNQAADNLIFQTVIFQGFIMEFSLPENRAAFLRGEICPSSHGEALLGSLDAIRNMMLPTLRTGTHGMLRDEYAIAAVKFFTGLVDKSGDKPRDVHGNLLAAPLTFKEWFSFIEQVSSSQYWRSAQHPEASVRPKNPSNSLGGFGSVDPLPRSSSRRADAEVSTFGAADCGLKDWVLPMDKRTPVKHCEALLHGDQVVKKSPVERAERCARGPKSQTHRTSDDKSSGSDSDSLRERLNRLLVQEGGRGTGRSRRRRTRRRMSTDSNSSITSDSPSESSDTKYTRQRGNDKLLNALKKLNRQRDAVPPGIFTGRGDYSLKIFLRDYEDYFEEKFSGNDRQKGRQLGQFLSEGVRRAYDAFDGSNLKYQVVKKKLHDWYQVNRVSSRRQAETHFDKAEKQHEDSYTVYTLRLEGLAEKAFPESSRDRERQLCRKMWRTAPKSFVRAMEESQRSLALLSGNPHLTWIAIKRLAENEDRRGGMKQSSDEEQSRRFRFNDELPIAATWAPARPRDTNQKRFSTTFYNRQRTSPSPSPPAERLGQRPVCCWCGRVGHVEDSCWEKSGSCLICGSIEHPKEECPRFNQVPPDFKATCSLCGGPHLGKLCDRALNQ